MIRLKTDKEHLTSFYYKNPKSFAIKNILCKINNISNLNFAIDTKRDLLRINKLFTKFKKPYELVGINEIISKTLGSS